jgi:DNA-directed RNA polymerase subunit RPC12/RpoP
LAKDHYKCLRCGNTYELEADPDGKIKERICPKCKSNSVRKLKTQ